MTNLHGLPRAARRRSEIHLSIARLTEFYKTAGRESPGFFRPAGSRHISGPVRIGFGGNDAGGIRRRERMGKRPEMKAFCACAAAFVTIMLMMPLLLVPLGSAGRRPAASSSAGVSAGSAALDTETEEVFRVFQTGTGQVEAIPAVDYICGVVAAEIPSGYREEALKAQAVAAFTYACYQREYGRAHPQAAAAIGGADLSDDSNYYEAYLPEDKAREKWGGSFESKWERIREAVGQVADKVIVYDGKPIDAVFFAVSSGKTEDSADVWGSSLPYLKSVDSSFDASSPDYESRKQVKKADFSAKVRAKYPKASLGADPSKWIADMVRSPAGGVKQASLGGVCVSGGDIRSLFGLKSAGFTVTYKDGAFTFDVKGDGHGVGMSQYGAECLAAQGKTWEQIVAYYYTGVTISDYRWDSVS